MKYTLSMRWLSVFGFVLIALTAVLGVATAGLEIDLDLLTLIDLSILEDDPSLTAHALLFMLLISLLTYLVAEFFGRGTLPAPPRVLQTATGRELLFDHGSRAPPH